MRDGLGGGQMTCHSEHNKRPGKNSGGQCREEKSEWEICVRYIIVQNFEMQYMKAEVEKIKVKWLLIFSLKDRKKRGDFRGKGTSLGAAINKTFKNWNSKLLGFVIEVIDLHRIFCWWILLFKLKFPSLKVRIMS